MINLNNYSYLVMQETCTGVHESQPIMQITAHGYACSIYNLMSILFYKIKISCFIYMLLHILCYKIKEMPIPCVNHMQVHIFRIGFMH